MPEDRYSEIFDPEIFKKLDIDREKEGKKIQDIIEEEDNESK